MTATWPTVDLLRHRCEVSPNREALVGTANGTTVSVEDLDETAGRLATSLADRVTSGDRVALLLGTRVAFVEVYWAVRRLGATVVPLNTRLPPSELREQLEYVDPAMAVCERESAAVVEGVDTPVVSVDRPEVDGITRLTPDRQVATPRPSGPGSIATILFTSGTTGRPKAVRVSVGNLLWSAFASALRLGVSPGDRWLCCLPMYHTGGLAPIVRTVIYGTAIVVKPEFDTGDTAAIIEEREITGVSLVPTMLRRLLDAGWDPPQQLETVLLGGAAADRSLIETALGADVPVAPTYGLTETTSQVATAHPDSVAAHPDSVGYPLLTTTVTIVDDAGEPVPAEEPGEIVVDGPTVTPGYLDADRTASAFGQYGLHTGDRGRRDQSGRLWILGRLDDRITSGGESVNPHAVEAVLERHPAVDTVAVVGLPDEEWGELVAVVFVPADDHSVTTDDLDSYCRDSLADYEIPRKWKRVDALPRTASGTVDRTAVKEILERDGQV